MGQRAHKMNRAESEQSVLQIKSAIATKRELLSQELDELKRRRATAVRRTKNAAQVGAVVAVGSFCAASLIKALCQLSASGKEDVQVEAEEKSATGQPGKSVFETSAVLSILYAIGNFVARDIVWNKVRLALAARMEHKNLPAPTHLVAPPSESVSKRNRPTHIPLILRDGWLESR